MGVAQLEVITLNVPDVVTANMLSEALVDETKALAIYQEMSKVEREATDEIMLQLQRRLSALINTQECPANSKESVVTRKLARVPVVICDITLTQRIKSYFEFLGYDVEQHHSTSATSENKIVSSVVVQI